MLNKKTVEQELTDCELRTITLTNENSELRMRLHDKEQEEYDKVKQLQLQLQAFKEANKRLTEELCEWYCTNCQADYYGPSAVERGSFKCISPDCKGRYCIPKKFLANNSELADNSVKELIEKISSSKKAA